MNNTKKQKDEESTINELLNYLLEPHVNEKIIDQFLPYLRTVWSVYIMNHITKELQSEDFWKKYYIKNLYYISINCHDSSFF
jgi:hypothetical protein